MKSMKEPMQNLTVQKIFEYDDYRKFLGDYFTEQKRISEIFSNRYFAMKAGFKSSSYILSVIKGRFNLSHTTLQKTISAMGINGAAAQFFENLVLYNQAKEFDEREKFLQNLEEIRKRTNFYKLDKKQYEYIKAWYFLVLREIATLYDWKDDYKKLARMVRPPISTEEARSAIEILLEIGLLKKDDAGRYHQNSASLNLEGVPKFLLTNLKKELIMRGADAIQVIDKSERFTAFSTLTMSKDSFDFACEVLEDARRKIIGKSLNDSNPDKVFEMNVMLFPVSYSVNKREREL
jgi:uncharacterized protein (TIGR02147 family)